MRIEQLEYLIAISRHPSLSAAAVELHLTPQALSISIKALEKELGFLLLNRTHQGVTLTAEAQTLVQLTKDYFRAVDQLIMQNNSHHQEELKGKVQLITTYGSVVSFLPQLMLHLFQDAPELIVENQEMSSKQAADAIKNHQVEFALYDHLIIEERPYFSIESFQLDILFQYRFYAQIPIAYPISRYKTISIHNLLKYPCICYAKNNNFENSTLAYLEHFGTPKKVYYINNQVLCRQMLSSGMGFRLTAISPWQNLEHIAIKNIINIPITDNLKLYCGLLSDGNIKEPLNCALYHYIKNNFSH